VLSWTYSALLIVEVQDNLFGQHIGKSDLSHLTSFMKIIYPVIILYTLALTISKLSLLALYWRIFRDSKGQWPIIVVAAVNVIWMIIIVFMSIFICHPIRGFWDFGVPSKCFKYNTVFVANEAITITLDVVMLLMPVYFISTIKRSVSQRISISSTFLLGLVVTIISAIRLWRLILSDKLERYGFDPTFDEVDSCLWGAIEINLWVLAASIPTLRPLLGKIIRNRKESRQASGSHTYVNSAGSRIKTRFQNSGRTLGTTLASLDSREGLGVEDCNVLIHAKSQITAGDVGKNASSNDYELRNVLHGIRVEKEVKVSRPHPSA